MEEYWKSGLVSSPDAAAGIADKEDVGDGVDSGEAAGSRNEMDRPIRLGGGRGGKRKGRRLVKTDGMGRREFTPEQRLMILDIWKRSGLPAKDFAPLPTSFLDHAARTFTS